MLRFFFLSILYGFEWYRRRKGGKWWRYFGENPSQGAHAIHTVDYDSPDWRLQ